MHEAIRAHSNASKRCGKLADFYKSQRVEEILPLIVGAENIKTLEIRHKIHLKRDQLEVEDLKLTKTLEASRMWLPRLRAYYLQFQEVGYIPQVLELDDTWTAQKLAELLRPIPDKVSTTVTPLPEGSGRVLARKIAALRRQAEDLAREIESLQRRMIRVESFQQLAGQYQSALSMQKDRLAPTGWLADHLRGLKACPFCDAENKKAQDQLAKLQAATQKTTQSLTDVDRAPSVVSEELLELEREQGVRQKELNGINELLERLTASNDEAQAQKRTSDARLEAAGELRAIIQTIDQVDDTGKLQTDVQKIKKEISELEARIDEKTIRATAKKKYDEISELIAHYAEIIGVEHSDRNPRLDPDRLTVKFKGSNGRDDYLWQIGSAANWMGYHVAALLAIHEVIRKLDPPSPVPQFIIFDQPSQPYFPEKGLKSEDLNRVRRVFEALSAFCVSTQDGVQVIVIEHAGEGAWKNIKHVTKKHEWRDDGVALIPQTWFRD